MIDKGKGAMDCRNNENTAMKFQFFCQEKGLSFECSDFSIFEDEGIEISPDGSRAWNAKVLLEEPCPHCGTKHIYSVNEIACPFKPC